MNFIEQKTIDHGEMTTKLPKDETIVIETSLQDLVIRYALNRLRLANGITVDVHYTKGSAPDTVRITVTNPEGSSK